MSLCPTCRAFIVLLAFLFAVQLASGQSSRVSFATYLGGSGLDSAYAVAVDQYGGIYVAGFTQSSDLSLVHPLRWWNAGGTGELFVAKFNSDGSAEYLTYIGGSGGEGDLDGYVGGIAVDLYGNVYIAGVTRSADFPVTTGALQTSIGSLFVCDADPAAGLCGDAFVLKLNRSGDQIVYSTFLGGADYDDAKAIAVDETGAAYVTGITASSDFPVTHGAFQTSWHDIDAYVAKISPDGARLEYSTYVGGTGFDAGMAIAVDSTGRVYVAGSSQSFDFPTVKPLQIKSGDSWDAIVFVLDPAGSKLEFATTLGGEGNQQALAIALDKHEDTYVAGWTDSGDIPIKQAFQQDFGGGKSNGFLTKIRSDGSDIVYSTFLGGADSSAKLNGVALDSAGNAYVTGQAGSDYPTVNSALTHSGGDDAVITKVSPDGAGVLFSTYVGGTGNDGGNGIAHLPDDSVVIVGYTSSANFPTTATAMQGSFAGIMDAFVVKLTQPADSGPIFSAPKSLQLGDAYPNSGSSSKSLRVQNTGVQPLRITQITSSPNVEVSSNCTTLSPAEACTIDAYLLTTESGDQRGIITIFDNAADSPQTIMIRATVVRGGDLSLSSLVQSAPFSFYGKTATPVLATIENNGPNDSDDVVVVAESSQAVADCNPCYIGQLRAGGSTTVRLNVIPSFYGIISVTVRIRSAPVTPDLIAFNNSQTLSIANPHYRIEPAQLAFDQQIVGTTSAPQKILFTSLDGAPLLLTVAGNAEFQPTLSCSLSSTQCFADISFAPRAAGLRTGNLKITDSSLQTMQSIPLQGAGISAPHARLSATRLGFVPTAVGHMSAIQSLTLVNDGSAPLFIVGTSISGEFTQSDNCPTSLSPGAGCTLSVRFAPVTAGTHCGELNVYDNTTGLMEKVLLVGETFALVEPSRPSRPSTAFAGTYFGSRSLANASQKARRPSVTQTLTTAVNARSTSSARPSKKPSRPEHRLQVLTSLGHSDTPARSSPARHR